MRTGVAVVELLQAYSVDQVFGIPGTHSIELYRGLSKSAIRHTQAEQAVASDYLFDCRNACCEGNALVVPQ